MVLWKRGTEPNEMQALAFSEHICCCGFWQDSTKRAPTQAGQKAGSTLHMLCEAAISRFRGHLSRGWTAHNSGAQSGGSKAGFRQTRRIPCSLADSREACPSFPQFFPAQPVHVLPYHLTRVTFRQPGACTATQRSWAGGRRWTSLLKARYAAHKRTSSSSN